MAAKKDSSIAAPVVSDKKKALETAMQQIEKTYGKGSIMRYGDNVQPNVEAIPTGSLALDLALNIPVSWLSILILSVVYHFSLLTVVLLLTLTLLAILCSGLFGLIINLHFPRFDFDREIVVVKQSLSTMITVLAGMGASFLILAVLLFWAPLESSLMMMVIALVLILLAAGMGIYLIRRGEALLSKLSGV